MRTMFFLLMIFILTVFSFTSYAMRADGINFKIQNLSGYKHLVATTTSSKVKFLEFDAERKSFKETNKIDLLYLSDEVSKDFCSVLERIALSDQEIVISTPESGELFRIVISRNHQDNPPVVKLRPSTVVENALYYPKIGGGGNSYLIATGKTKSDISPETVRVKQKNTRRQVYFLVE